MKRKIPEANKTPTGWWVAIIFERFVPKGRPPSRNTICEVWENEILVRAPSREAAYSKVIKYGRDGQGPSPVKIGKRDGEWVFDGIGTLLPVYDKFADFSEIRWTRHRCRLQTVRSWSRRKKDLECFQDK